MANVESLLRKGWDPDFGGAETKYLDIFDFREPPHYFLISLISNFDITAVKIAATNFRVDEGGRRSSKFSFHYRRNLECRPTGRRVSKPQSNAARHPRCDGAPSEDYKISKAVESKHISEQGSALALPKPQQTAEVLTVQTIMIGDISNTIAKASASKHRC
ncbi:uncharacterized protein RSE6_12335 [Rhynchosporium secalis]|uniref:Uncharacterized protein n=1 Tax=Rhynchosporium secalis TaxID=38038 RepID=A0A1E1MR29_RHYSE|nr:uncharacterized protein RSE6_12335 [Rhynchosporium secalis]